MSTHWLTALIAGLLLSAGVSAADSRVPLPEIVKGKGDACVEPSEVMRRDHMRFLHAHRDETVRSGDRAPRHSLAGCVDCHSVPDSAGAHVPVDAPGQFCASCHAYASVKIDCFECHSTVPTDARAVHRTAAEAPLLDRLSRALFGASDPGAAQ